MSYLIATHLVMFFDQPVGLARRREAGWRMSGLRLVYQGPRRLIDQGSQIAGKEENYKEGYKEAEVSFDVGRR